MVRLSSGIRVAVVLVAIGTWAQWPHADSPAEAAKEAGQPAQPRPLPADLDFVPRKVFGFVSIRAADVSKAVVDAEMLKKLQKTPIYAAAGNPGWEEIERKLGVGASEIERAVFVLDELDLLGGNANNAVVLLTTAKAYDQKKVSQGLAPNAKEEKQAGKTCYVAGDSALHFIDDRSFCFGETKTVRKWLTMTRDERTQGPLQGALRLAVHNHLVLGFNPDQIAAFVPLVEGQVPAEFRPIFHLAKTRSTVLAVHVGKELEIDLFLNYGEARPKDQAIRDIKAALPKLQEVLAPLGKLVADQGHAKAGKFIDLSAAAIKKTPVREEDLRVHVPLYVPSGAAGLRAVLEEVLDKVVPPGDKPAEAKPEAPAADAKQAEAIWSDWLQVDEAGTKQAYQHMRVLMEKPDDAVRFVKARLKPVTAPMIPQRLAKLIADLASDQFQARQNATEQLEKLGKECRPALLKELGSKPPLEMRTRIEQLLTKIDGPGLAPETVRELRGVEILLRVATPEARALLKELAGGTAGFPLTAEAQNALERLGKTP